MSDEDKKALNEAGEEASDSATPAEETKATEEVTKEEPKGEESSETETKVTETEESKKKGYSARVRELDHKAKQAEAKAVSLEEKLAELTSQLGSGAQAPYTSQVQPGAEVTPEQYEQDVTRRADSLVQLRLQQERVITNINREASEAVGEYPELNPKSDTFNRDLSDSVTEAAWAFAQANPTGSVKKFVDKLMKPYRKAVTKEVGQQSENLAKQVSEAALRPTTITKTAEKDFKDLPIEEMEKKLGTVS